MKGILVDVTKCNGCMECVHACVQRDGERPIPTTRGEAGLSGTQRSTIIAVGEKTFARKACLHCVSPNCEAACLVGALHKSENGPVVYDADKCIGCRYCMLACQFHIPRYEWHETHPIVQKCDMCSDKIDKGETPRCVSACRHGVLEFGERDALLEKARSIVENNPNKYRQRVYGEVEWGGTAVLYISEEPLDALGWPKTDVRDPISTLTDPLIHATPVIGIGVLLGTVGLGAIIQRRNKLMKENHTDSKADNDKDKTETREPDDAK